MRHSWSQGDHIKGMCQNDTGADRLRDWMAPVRGPGSGSKTCKAVEKGGREGPNGSHLTLTHDRSKGHPPSQGTSSTQEAPTETAQRPARCVFH